ncbi:MAG: NlpC/P60 family protein [Corynebacterium sp.]|nr:NlpC/P60 family protein [Corynebacterium sp.]
MATTSNGRRVGSWRARRIRVLAYFRRTVFASAACVACISTVSAHTPASAAPEYSTIGKLADALKGQASVSELAGTIADVQGLIADVEAEIGKIREDANRMIVDLQDARTLAAQAHQGTLTARNDLLAAQNEVAAAQQKLNELSRAAYRRPPAGDAITAASGQEARDAALARRSYVQAQTRQQRQVVAELERQRTNKANKESQLREVENLAHERTAAAEKEEAQARSTLAATETKLSALLAERDQLSALEAQAHDSLVDARGGEASSSNHNDGVPESPVSGGEPSQSATAASAPQVRAGESESSSPTATTTAETTTSEKSVEPKSETSSAAAAEAPAGAENSTVTEEPADQGATASGLQAQAVESPAPETADDRGNESVATDSATHSESSANTDLAISALNAAAAIIAAAQPEHSLAADSNSTAANTTGSGESTLFALQHATDADSAVPELLDVLPTLSTTESVTEKASEVIGDASREAKIEAVIARAQSQIGVPYAWGGGDANGPTRGIRDGGVADSHGDFNKVGFDCSGLVLYAFAGAGINLPHFTGYQYNRGQKVSPQEMQRGDLIFYGPGGNQHVAIYLGDGTMLEAPQSGSNVQISPVRWSGMTPYAVRLI